MRILYGATAVISSSIVVFDMQWARSCEILFLWFPMHTTILNLGYSESNGTNDIMGCIVKC